VAAYKRAGTGLLRRHGQSNIESFRLAAHDPDAVAVKTAAIAALMLKSIADDLLE
jgi:hypothetical protein